jgi:hypothetical protein
LPHTEFRAIEVTVIMAVSQTLKVAVILNGSAAHQEHVKKDFNHAIHSLSPITVVDFYDPIVSQQYPNQNDYDLVVISGGGTDPRSLDP